MANSFKNLIVTPDNFREVVTKLQEKRILSLDCETTGLRVYHGDRLFALILGTGHTNCYFNFNPDSNPVVSPHGTYLSKWYLNELQEQIFSQPEFSWLIHNAKFDMAVLAREKCKLAGEIFCTRAMGRIAYNEHFSYSLENSAKRIELYKSDAVEEYIKQHKLYAKKEIPGKNTSETVKYFHLVPFEIMSTYACLDAEVTFKLGKNLFQRLHDMAPEPNSMQPDISKIVDNEMQLTKTLFEMQETGLRVDIEYCKRAIEYEKERGELAEEVFKVCTGKDYKASPKLFAEVFENQRDKWSFTEKGNPSFDTDALKRFSGDSAKAVLTIRDAKSRMDFYHGFIYHADSEGIIHPNLNQDGAATGRLSGSDPNFQNLTAEKDQTQKFLVRRAIVPRQKGGWLVSLDYDQMEYRMMLDLACRLIKKETELVRLVKSGLDVHTATAQIAGINRDQAKTTNFLTIYGGGNAKLAENLGCSLEKAKEIREAIFGAAPEMKQLINAVMNAATNRDPGFIFNWLGRICYFPDHNFAYKAPNYLIQGGCADVVKVAMNQIHEWLEQWHPNVKLVLQVHDELILDFPNANNGYPQERVLDVINHVKGIMEKVYPSKYLPLTCGAEWSQISLGDMKKVEAGNEVPNQ